MKCLPSYRKTGTKVPVTIAEEPAAAKDRPSVHVLLDRQRASLKDIFSVQDAPGPELPYSKEDDVDLSKVLKALREADALTKPAKRSKRKQKLLPDSSNPPYVALPSSVASTLGAVDQESFFIQNGVSYMPLPDAVRYTGVNRDTLLNWIKNKVQFKGEPIDAVYFKLTGNHFISKLSVERIADRFVKWPSEEPASNISLGQTEQKTGYLSISDAASLVGMPDVTLRKWVRERSAPPPLNDLLEVVKDTASGYFYIQQQGLEKLAAHVKEFGVSRGRRIQPS